MIWKHVRHGAKSNKKKTLVMQHRVKLKNNKQNRFNVRPK